LSSPIGKVGGVGRGLWNEARRLAASPSDTVFTVDSSVQAVGFYRRLGFMACGTVTRAKAVVYVPMRRPAR
jgi:predicted GNAT family N-acyltransferase